MVTTGMMKIETVMTTKARTSEFLLVLSVGAVTDF
jgi:hypothetical protein